MPPDSTIAATAEALAEENTRLKRKLERERTVRLEAERIAENGLRDLYNRQMALQTLEQIATRANADGSIRDVLQFAITEICRHHDWKVGHAYRVRHHDGQPMLVTANIWFDTNQAFHAFRHVTRHAQFRAGHGLPGRALATALPVWITNLSLDTNFPRLGVSEASGLKSAVAFPVLSGATVVAVLEFFDTEIRAPSESLLDMLRQAGTQLGRVIERRQAQEALEAHARELAKARDEAQAADRAKSAFLAAMSHELRTPLNAIIGFSEVMLDEIFGPLSTRYKDYTADIRKSGVNLKNIINDILDLSKVAVGELVLRETLVSLLDVAENCDRTIRPLAEQGRITFLCDVPADLPCLHADETRLQQTLVNLLSNAVKFTPPGGRVSLQAKRSGDTVCVMICDTGIGMSADEIAVALQPFRQIDSSLARRYEGTGLGLPLARALVELHGGELVIASEPKMGTTVHISLPASRVLQAAAA